MKEYRKENDTLGEVDVPADKYWGAQTERCRNHFSCTAEPMPADVIHAIALIKKAAALANSKYFPEKMTINKLGAISSICDAVGGGKYDDHFPLSIWQSGSGTQTNMNVNEVIASLVNEVSGKKIVHPNDDVNMSQSTNDVFPSAINIASVFAVKYRLLTAIDLLVAEFRNLEAKYPDQIKCGRTHMMDAVPIKFSQEVSGWRGALEKDREQIVAASEELKTLALGGTAVGTGLNSHPDFGEHCAKDLSYMYGIEFHSDDNKFRALGSRGSIVFAHGALKALAADLIKIANDIRKLASGPRCGFGEISIPVNEPGSSIMPGKVNPTQCEALIMAATQVLGNDATIGIAASLGDFELNVYAPLIANCMMQSIRILTDSMCAFRAYCVAGIEIRADRMQNYFESSLMTVTGLSKLIGYEDAAKVAKLAYDENLTVKEACLKLEYLDEKTLNEKFRPEEMI